MTRPSSDPGPPGPGPAEEAAPGLEQRLAELRAALPEGCRLLAVSKGQPASRLRAAVAAGQRSFGESRVQEAIAKQAQLADLEPLDWHFIGRLQANKVRPVLRHFGTVHSLDSLDLARRMARIAAEEECSPLVFCQVKLRADPAKAGFAPEELQACWSELIGLAPLRVRGLMTIASQGLDRSERQDLFAACAALARDLGLEELSMGMSGDWPEAVRAGSTWVRIGSGLFGSRPGN